MKFVWVNNDHLPRKRSARLPAIAESLYAADGQANCVSVVPVEIKTVSVELCLNPLNSAFCGRQMDGVVI